MSFTYKELFVLFAIFEAISGLALNNSSSRKSQSKDLSPIYSVTEKFQNPSADNSSTELVTVLIPNSSNSLSNSSESPDKPVTTATTPSTITKSTSVAPTTTTTPVPQPWQTDQWVVRDTTTNKTCIIAEMAMQLNITYSGKNQTLQNATVNIPKKADYNGSCEDNSQYLNISWGPGYSLLINFGINKTANTYFISGISLDVNATVLEDAPDIGMLHFTNESKEFATPLSMSYKCNKIQDINLKQKQGNGVAVLHLKNTQFEAYMNKTKAEFGAAQDCDAFDTPDIVPIAVGCALAILVLVVLVAYLIARKRSHSQGYLSM